MADVKRWSVAYTKHVKQKRKVYQDGFLHLSSNKVMLYDDSEKLLDCRFLKKDEAVESGETLAFDSYLVDIGDPEEDCKLVTNPNSHFHSKENTITRKAELPHRKTTSNNLITSDKRKPIPGRRKASAVNMSPSQKIIREYKKNEMQKYGLQQSPPTLATSTVKEWQVLYTGQMAQKAKKYHDGIIQLVMCGSHGRFIKKDEVITSGESLTFSAYLVDIGEPEGNHEPLVDPTVQGKSCNEAGKTQMHWFKDTSSTGQHQPDAFSGKDVDSKSCSSGSVQTKLQSKDPTTKPLRDAHEILSNLRKSVAPESIPVTKGAPVKQCISLSSDLVVLDDMDLNQLAGQLARDSEHSISSAPEETKNVEALNEGFTRTNSCGSNIPQPMVSQEDVSCKIKQEKNCGDGGKLQPQSSTSTDFCFGFIAASRLKAVINAGHGNDVMDRAISSEVNDIYDAVSSHSLSDTRPITGSLPHVGPHTSVDLGESSDLVSSKDCRDNPPSTSIDIGGSYQPCTKYSTADLNSGEKHNVDVSGSVEFDPRNLGVAERKSTGEINSSAIVDD
ncbi:hypothetical protein Ancab_015540 [Ancistrocladus abbreviatus]